MEHLGDSANQSLEHSLSSDVRYFTQLGLRLLSFVFATFFVLCFVFFYNGSLDDRRQLERQVLQVVDSLSVPMSNFNYQSAEAIATQLLNFEGIEAIFVVDSFGVTIKNTFTPDDVADKPDIAIFQDNNPEQVIGTVSIAYATAGLASLILWSSFYATVLALLFMVPTVLYFYYYLQQYIRAPLLALNEAILETSRTGETAMAGYDQKNAFGILAARFNQMQNIVRERTLESENALKHVSMVLEALQENKNAMAATLSAIKQTVIMVDRTGKTLALNISQPFEARDKAKFEKSMALERPLDGLQQQFSCNHFAVLEEGADDTTVFSVRLTTGQNIRGILVMSTQFRALILIDQTEFESSQAVLDEVLTETDVGLVFIRESGEVISHKGAHFERLFTNPPDKSVSPMKKLPSHFTQMANEQRSIEVKNKVYYLRAVSLPAQTTCIVHFDISSARDMEKRLQDSESLSNIGRMASGLAHDFNNILGVIMSSLEIMDERYDVGEFIEPAITAAGRGADVVKEILSYARSSKVETETVFVDDLLAYNQEVFARASSDDVTVTVKSQTDAWITIDRSMFMSMMLNLTVNANNAMEGRGEILIETSLESADAHRQPDWLVMTFSDNGPGVPDSFREKIFEPFFTTRTQDGGTGLGLAMASNFVRASGGNINLVESDRGACFEIRLPVEAMGANVAKRLDRVSEPVIPETDAPGLLDIRVILVDDEVVLLKMLRKVLELAGCQVDVFTSAEACLEGWEDLGDADLLITDNNMPTKTGMELVRILRARGVDIPIMVMSGIVSVEMEKEGVELEVAEFLWKPIPRATLIEAISRYVSTRSEQIKAVSF